LQIRPMDLLLRIAAGRLASRRETSAMRLWAN
jgi:hypothetical protein